MNKRDFLKSILIGCVAPSILVASANDHYKWKKYNNIWIPNPEYITAPYEIVFYASFFPLGLDKTYQGEIPPTRLDANFKEICLRKSV